MQCLLDQTLTFFGEYQFGKSKTTLLKETPAQVFSKIMAKFLRKTYFVKQLLLLVSGYVNDYLCTYANYSFTSSRQNFS